MRKEIIRMRELEKTNERIKNENEKMREEMNSKRLKSDGRIQTRMTYADAVSNKSTGEAPSRRTLHSVVVRGVDESETGEEASLWPSKDEEIIRDLRSKNKDIFDHLEEGNDRLKIKYRRRARNPLTCHVVMEVSPTIWSKALEKRVRQDRPPEGEGAGSVPADPVLTLLGIRAHKEILPDDRRQMQPLAGVREDRHNAFSPECQQRRKWDELARQRVAYC
ncbi:hypothetical protein ACJJTC_005654 [Scirpophaga incertulas]